MPTHPTRTLLILLAILIIAVGLAYALMSIFVAPAAAPQPTMATFPKDAPAPTTADHVTAQHGFQYLVSYTNTGFAPKTLSVKKGETVRFTNNSAGTLQLSLTGAPQTSVAHAAYFEYTFSEVGTFTYSDGTRSGTVTVK